jgi:hypothetical protein
MNESTTDQTKQIRTPRDPDNAMQTSLLEVIKRFPSKAAHRSEFVTPVVSVSADRATVKVRLCTGSVIDVPVSVLTSMAYLGAAGTDDESLMIASGDIDVSTDSGILIQQLANEIIRLTRQIAEAKQPLSVPSGGVQLPVEADGDKVLGIQAGDTVLPEAIIKIPFTGTAGFPKAIYYSKPVFQYIQQWSIFQLLRCSMIQPPQIIATGHDGNRPDRITEIQFVLDAAPGTPLGTTYNGQLELDVTLVQETT